MSRELCIRSARDGVTLTLSNFVYEGEDSMSDSFLVEVKAYDLRAEARASTFMAADLGQFFTSLAKDWKGWRGERTWATLEGEFELTATTDPLGNRKASHWMLKPRGIQMRLNQLIDTDTQRYKAASQQSLRAGHRQR